MIGTNVDARDNEYFKGYIDDLFLYQYALDGTQITDIYKCIPKYYHKVSLFEEHIFELFLMFATFSMRWDPMGS